MNGLTLSQAIRLGSMLKPQAFDWWTPGSTCALQAACEAVGKDINDWDMLNTEFPLLDALACCPVAGCRDAGDLCDIVYHLNDQHEWSREQIADHVETIENQQADMLPELLEAQVAE